MGNKAHWDTTDRISAIEADRIVRRFRSRRVLRGVAMGGALALMIGAGAAWMAGPGGSAGDWLRRLDGSLGRASAVLSLRSTPVEPDARDQTLAEAPDPDFALRVETEPVARSIALDTDEPATAEPVSEAAPAPAAQARPRREADARRARERATRRAPAIDTDALPSGAAGLPEGEDDAEDDEIKLEDDGIPGSDLPRTSLSPDYAP